VEVLQLDAHAAPQLGAQHPPRAAPGDALERLELDGREGVRGEDVVGEADGGAPGGDRGDEEESRGGGGGRGGGGRSGGRSGAGRGGAAPASSAPAALRSSSSRRRRRRRRGGSGAFAALSFFFCFAAQGALERPRERRGRNGSFGWSRRRRSSADEPRVAGGDRPGDESRGQVPHVGGGQGRRVARGREAGSQGVEEAPERAACVFVEFFFVQQTAAALAPIFVFSLSRARANTSLLCLFYSLARARYFGVSSLHAKERERETSKEFEIDECIRRHFKGESDDSSSPTLFICSSRRRVRMGSLSIPFYAPARPSSATSSSAISARSTALIALDDWER